MSRDAFSYDPQDAGEMRDTSTRRSVRQRRPTSPDARDSRNPALEDRGRGDDTAVREQHSTRDERSDSPRAYYVRDRAYLLRDSEIHSLTEIGKFRVIAGVGPREICLRRKSRANGERHPRTRLTSLSSPIGPLKSRRKRRCAL